MNENFGRRYNRRADGTSLVLIGCTSPVCLSRTLTSGVDEVEGREGFGLGQNVIHVLSRVWCLYLGS